MSDAHDTMTKNMSPDTVGAIQAVVAEVVADIFDRNLPRSHVEDAKNRGEYVALYDQVQQHLASLESVNEDTLRSESARIAKQWQGNIRGSTKLIAKHPSDPEEYEVECWLQNDLPSRPSLRRKTVPGHQTNATFENLPPGKWVMRVRGVNAAGAGPWTEEISVVVSKESNEP